MKERISIFLDNKFNSDVAWNVGSYAILGGAGILINIFIVSFFSYDLLGVFNQVFAIYAVTSQIAIFGIHLSIQRFIPHFTTKLHSDIIFSGSIYLTLLISLLIVLMLYFFVWYSNIFPYDEQVRIGTLIACPGIFFFAINKLFMAFLNGKRLMKHFAVFNSLRFILLFSGVIFLYSIDKNIMWTLTLTEIILFIPLTFCNWKKNTIKVWQKG